MLIVELQSAWDALSKVKEIKLEEGFLGDSLFDEFGNQRGFSVNLPAAMSRQIGAMVDAENENIKGVGATETFVEGIQWFNQVFSFGVTDYELIRILDASATNYNLSSEMIIEFLRLWDPICQFELGHCSTSSLGVRLKKLPEKIDAFCQAAYWFCPDIFYFDRLDPNLQFEVKLIGPDDEMQPSDRQMPEEAVSWFRGYLKKNKNFLDFWWD